MAQDFKIGQFVIAHTGKPEDPSLYDPNEAI